MSTVVPNIFTRLVDANGETIAGGKVFWYAAGTSSPATVYSDSATTIPLPNPVVADSSGAIVPQYAKDGNYKIVITDASGATIYTLDNYSIVSASGGSSLVSSPVVLKTANYTVQASDRNTVIIVDASRAPGQNVAITADSAALTNGFPFTVINVGSVGSVTIVGASGQTVNQSASFTLTSQNQSASFASNGAAGWVISGSTVGAFINGVTFFAYASFKAQVQYAEQTIPWVASPGSTIFDPSQGADGVLTLIGAATTFGPLANQANLKGARGQLRFLQDATGRRSIGFDPSFYNPWGAISVSSAPNSETVYNYWVSAASGNNSVVLTPRLTQFGPHVIIEDQKPSGTSGQVIPAGTDTQANLNIITWNTGNVATFATLVNNQFTIPGGTYYVTFWGSAANTNTARIFLQNVTDNTPTVYGGAACQNATGVYSIGERPLGAGIFTIASDKTFELRMRTSHATTATPANDGKPEIYTHIEITKLA